MKPIIVAAAFAAAVAAAPASAGQSLTGFVASFHGKALGKGWGQAVSDRSKVTNSGRAGGEETPGPGHSGSNDPGVGNTAGIGGNNGNE